MSILIPGMEMPTSCARCPCANDETPFCRAANKYIPMLGKPEWCPLIELPPHGRLIDVSKLPFDDVRLDEFGDWWMAVEDIEAAPTIIPADGGDAE